MHNGSPKLQKVYYLHIFIDTSLLNDLPSMVIDIDLKILGKEDL